MGYVTYSELFALLMLITTIIGVCINVIIALVNNKKK